ncbi:unnamed protein product [Amoebophrya sp. A120]|nr:unnamed protein product [Amoebophrya sp. A120]|eukprot:GSA120T00022709001.1
MKVEPRCFTPKATKARSSYPDFLARCMAQAQNHLCSLLSGGLYFWCVL